MSLIKTERIKFNFSFLGVFVVASPAKERVYNNSRIYTLREHVSVYMCANVHFTGDTREYVGQLSKVISKSFRKI